MAERAATQGRDPASLRWGWPLAALSFVLPLFALAGIVFGVVVAQRGRPGHGAGMIIVSLIGAVVSLTYLGSQTLVPR